MIEPLIVTTEGHALSAHNAQLVLARFPTARRVGGFNQWLKVGRCVRKGEKAIAIFRPRIRSEDAETESDQGADSGTIAGMFRVYVFAEEQTEPIAPEVAQRILAAKAKRAEQRAERASDAPTTPHEAAPEAGCFVSPRFLAAVPRIIEKAQARRDQPRKTNTNRRLQIAESIARDCDRIIDACRLAQACAESAKLADEVRQIAGIDTITSIDKARGALWKVRRAREDGRAMSAELIAFLDGATPSQTAAQLAAQKEAHGRGFERFETREHVARLIAELADLRPGLEVLEPSCGSGALVAVALAAGCSVHGIELSEAVAKLAQTKNPQAFIECRDFDQFTPVAPYDRVLMNPPFSRDQEHIRRAFDMLAPGGVLVAICGEGSFTGRRRSDAWLQWLDEVRADVRPCPEDAFEGTTARARILKIIKHA